MKIINNMKKPSIGTWLTIYSEAIAEILCNSGYEWITIDLEHTPITLSQAEKLIRVIDLKGVKPFVRVSSNNEAEIKKVLDFGARGVIVPMVNNVTDVKKAIAYSFYPPQGKRGMGLYRAQGYGDEEMKMEYIKSTSRDIELFVNIESKEAVENIDEIILGCSHYPLIYDILKNKVHRNLKIIDPSISLIKKFNDSFLKPKNDSSDSISYDNVEFFVTSKSEEFAIKVKNWLEINKEIRLVNLRSND